MRGTGVWVQATPASETERLGADARVGQLIADARAGDVEAFGILYSEHVHRVQAYARRLASHEHAAQDLVSEAFVRTWQQLRAGNGPTTAFLAYVRAAVLNLHLSHLRQEQRLRWVEDIESAAMSNPALAARIVEQSPDHLVLEQLLNQQMKHALATLPERWQLVIVWVYIEDRPYREVAADLGLTVEAARQLARRARVGMRKALADGFDEDWAAA